MKRNFFILLTVALFFSACSSVKVTADYDGSVDFTKFKTYSYLGWSSKSADLITDFDKRRFEAAFASEFDKRGIKYVLEDGDMMVSLFLVTEEKTSTTAYTDYYGGYGGYGYRSAWGWGGGYATTTYHQYDYTEGTLVCDVFDSSNKKMVWQSVGSGTIDKSNSGRDKAIIQAVHKMMSLYPIEAAK